MGNELITSINNISDSLNRLEDSTSSIERLIEKLEELNTTASTMNSKSLLDYFDIVDNVFSTVSSTINTIENTGETIENFGNILEGFLKQIGASEGVISTFSGALSFLAQNPIVAVIGALGLVVGALAIFDWANGNSEEATDKSSDAIEKQTERLKELNEELGNVASTNKEKVQGIIGDYDLLLSYVDKLDTLSKGGIDTSNLAEAQYYIDEINKILPDSVSLTKDNTVEWKNNSSEVKKNIELLKQKAIVEQQAQKYLDIMSKELEIKREYSQAEQEYFGTLKEIAELKEQGYPDDNRMVELISRLPQLKENYDNASLSMGELNKATQELNLSYESLSGNVQSKGELLASQWTTLEENGKVSFSSLGTALNEFNLKYDELSNSNNETSQKEAETYKSATDKIKQTMIEKAYQYGMSYEDMINSAEKNGVKLNETDKKFLKNSYDIYKEGWDSRLAGQLESNGKTYLNDQLMFTKLSDQQKAQLLKAAEGFSQGGNKNGFEYIAALLSSLKDNDGKVTSQTRKMLEDLEKMANDTDPNVQIGVKSPPSKSVDKVKEILGTIPTFKDITCNVKAQADKKSFNIFGIKIPVLPYAVGGFPDTGELFLAREAGPELVGRINGKTAVANNDQIVSGISSGVFNAVASAMKGLNTQGSMNIHATFVMDGDVVGKQVIKYHNGVVRRTGHSPLMI